MYFFIIDWWNPTTTDVFKNGCNTFSCPNCDISFSNFQNAFVQIEKMYFSKLLKGPQILAHNLMKAPKTDGDGKCRDLLPLWPTKWPKCIFTNVVISRNFCTFFFLLKAVNQSQTTLFHIWLSSGKGQMKIIKGTQF